MGRCPESPPPRKKTTGVCSLEFPPSYASLPLLPPQNIYIYSNNKRRVSPPPRPPQTKKTQKNNTNQRRGLPPVFPGRFPQFHLARKRPLPLPPKKKRKRKKEKERQQHRRGWVVRLRGQTPAFRIPSHEPSEAWITRIRSSWRRGTRRVTNESRSGRHGRSALRIFAPFSEPPEKKNSTPICRGTRAFHGTTPQKKSRGARRGAWVLVRRFFRAPPTGRHVVVMLSVAARGSKMSESPQLNWDWGEHLIHFFRPIPKAFGGM